MTEGWAARSAREARKVQPKKSIVSFEARVGPVPTLTACMMINLIVVMMMVNMMMTMNITRTNLLEDRRPTSLHGLVEPVLIESEPCNVSSKANLRIPESGTLQFLIESQLSLIKAEPYNVL